AGGAAAVQSEGTGSRGDDAADRGAAATAESNAESVPGDAVEGQGSAVIDDDGARCGKRKDAVNTRRAGPAESERLGANAHAPRRGGQGLAGRDTDGGIGRDIDAGGAWQQPISGNIQSAAAQRYGSCADVGAQIGRS